MTTRTKTNQRTSVGLQRVSFLLSVLFMLTAGAASGGDAQSSAASVNGTSSAASSAQPITPPAHRTDSPAQEPITPISEKPVGAKSPLPAMSPQELMRSGQTVILFGLISLVPVAVLMLTAFVRINIVLILLRQALGSPQVPGNQVLTALALLLTALVMRPTAETVYHDAVAPYLAGQIKEKAAWQAACGPIKTFMIREIYKTSHQNYLYALTSYDNRSPSAVAPTSLEEASELPLRVVAPAFLLSELTAALLIGFYLYLPFLVIDLVVAAVLAASGLFMLPPSLVSTPVKLLLFVLADGWMLVAQMILSSYGVATTGH